MAIRVRYEPAAVGLALASDLAGRGQLAKERQRLLEERRRFDEEFLERQRQFDVGQEFREKGFDEDVRRFDLGRGDNLGQASFSNWIEAQKLGEGQRQFNLSLQERYARDRQDRRDRAAMERLANERALMAQQGAMARQNMASQQANIRQQQQNAANQGRWQQQRLHSQMNADWQQLLNQRHTMGRDNFEAAKAAFIDKYSGHGIEMPFDLPQRQMTPAEIDIQQGNEIMRQRGFQGNFLQMGKDGQPEISPMGLEWQRKQDAIERREIADAKAGADRHKKATSLQWDATTGLAEDFHEEEQRYKSEILKDEKDLIGAEGRLNSDGKWGLVGTVVSDSEGGTSDIYTSREEYLNSKAVHTDKDGLGDELTPSEKEQKWAEFDIARRNYENTQSEHRTKQNDLRTSVVAKLQRAEKEGTIVLVRDGDRESIARQLMGIHIRDGVLPEDGVVMGPDGPVGTFRTSDYYTPDQAEAPVEEGQGQPPLTPMQRGPAPAGPAPTAVPATTSATLDIIPVETNSDGMGVDPVEIIRGEDGKLYYDDGQRTPVAYRDRVGRQVDEWREVEDGRWVAYPGTGSAAAQMYPIQAEKHRRKLQAEGMGQTADAIAASPEDTQVVEPDVQPEAPREKRDRSGGESRYIRPKRRIINPETNSPYKGKRITLPRNATPEQIEAYDRAVANAQAWADDLDKGREYHLESDEYEAEQEARRKDRRERLAREKAEQEERDSLPFRGFNPLPGGAPVHAIRGIVPTTMGDINPSKRGPMSAEERWEHGMRVEETDPDWGRRRYPDSVQDIMGQEYPDRIENRIVDVYDEVAPAPGVARGEYFGQKEGTVRDSQVPQRVVVDEAQREFDDYDKQNQEVFEASDRLKEIQVFFEEHDILQGMNWEDIYKEVVEPLFLGHGPTSDTLAGPVSRTEDGIPSGKLRIPKKLNKLKGKEKEEAIKQYFEMVSELYHLIPLLYGKDSPLPAHHGRDPLRRWMGNSDYDIWAGDDETNRLWDKKTGRKNRGRETQGRWRTR